jgi:enoyl-CoA hydratase
MRMVLATPSFYEGVRAVIIDKDNKPKWTPSNLAGIDDTLLASLFKEFGAEEKHVYGPELFG